MSFLAATEKLLVQRGATWSAALIVDNGSNNDLMDLTGRFARMQIRDQPEGGNVICDVLCIIDPDQSVNSSTRGRIDLYIHVPFTLLMPITKQGKEYYYDIELVLPNAYTVGNNTYDHVDRLLQGRVSVSPNATAP